MLEFITTMIFYAGVGIVMAILIAVIASAIVQVLIGFITSKEGDGSNWALLMILGVIGVEFKFDKYRRNNSFLELNCDTMDAITTACVIFGGPFMAFAGLIYCWQLSIPIGTIVGLVFAAKWLFEFYQEFQALKGEKKNCCKDNVEEEKNPPTDTEKPDGYEAPLDEKGRQEG